MKFVIIGAGPVGCYAGYLLASEGHDVEIYEEHEEIGLPFQCTGLLTGSFEKLLTLPDDVIENRINKINVFSPDKNKLELNLNKEEIVLDRTKFDKYLAKLAKNSGAKIFTSHRYVNYSMGEVKIIDIKNKKTKIIKPDFLIGADGPKSKIRELISNQEIEYYVGAQATINLEHEENSFDTFFGEDFPYFFGWIVPLSKNISRIGLAAKNKSGLLFNQFLRNKIGEGYKKSLCAHQGGLIPVYCSKLTIKKGNIAIIGDAATHVKSTTGGGIIPGMNGAKEIIQGILSGYENMKNNQLKINRQLKLHNMTRNLLDSFTDKNYNKLIKLCKQKKIKEILETNSRDYPSKFVMKMLLKEPRFLTFITKLWSLKT